jgi:hypothetical protein
LEVAEGKRRLRRGKKSPEEMYCHKDAEIADFPKIIEFLILELGDLCCLCGNINPPYPLRVL